MLELQRGRVPSFHDHGCERTLGEPLQLERERSVRKGGGEVLQALSLDRGEGVLRSLRTWRSPQRGAPCERSPRLVWRSGMGTAPWCRRRPSPPLQGCAGGESFRRGLPLGRSSGSARRWRVVPSPRVNTNWDGPGEGGPAPGRSPLPAFSRRPPGPPRGPPPRWATPLRVDGSTRG